MSERAGLDELYDRLDIPLVGRHAIESIRNSPPARRVDSGRGNVAVRFPSRKMGHVVQAESGTIEYPFVLECEHDPEVLEIWDQVAPLTVRYRGSDGRQRAHRETTDFLVIKRDRI